jgi:iron(III) transport system permease protein
VFFEWALVLPLAMPAYVLAYVYTDFLQFVGPVQSWLRETFGWSRGDYWFPGRAQRRRRGRDVRVRALSLRLLLARTAFIERASGMLEAARTLGLGPWRSFLRVSLPLARPAVVGGRGAGLDGDAGRLRHRVLLRRADLHHRHLSRLVLARRPHRCRATCGVAARFRDPAAASGTVSRGRARFNNTTGRNRPLAGARSGWAAAVAVLACALPL